MGRKIPAKKHRGVKDPIKQQAQRLHSVSKKINLPPREPDEQPVPRSLTRLFAPTQLRPQRLPGKQKPTKPLQHYKDSSRSRSSKAGDGNPVSGLRRLPGESGRSFTLRINSAIRALHTPAENHDHMEDLEEDDVKGSRMAERRERRARKRRRPARDGADASEERHKLTHTQKLALKRKAKKLKAAERAADEVQYEAVRFGDVVAAPPTLTAPRRAPPRVHAARPGQRKLLLSGMLSAGGSGKGGAGAGSDTSAERRCRERARLEAVVAYRALRANTSKRTSNKT